MNKAYETLDEYLDDLDKIKESIAAETKGMSPSEVVAYFAQTQKKLEKITGKKLRVRKPGRKKKATSGARG